MIMSLRMSMWTQRLMGGTPSSAWLIWRSNLCEYALLSTIQSFNCNWGTPGMRSLHQSCWWKRGFGIAVPWCDWAKDWAKCDAVEGVKYSHLITLKRIHATSATSRPKQLVIHLVTRLLQRYCSFWKRTSFTSLDSNVKKGRLWKQERNLIEYS